MQSHREVMTMAKILIITSRMDTGITQTVVKFPHVTYAEEAITQIENTNRSNPIIDVRAIRLYDPHKGGK